MDVLALRTPWLVRWDRPRSVERATVQLTQAACVWRVQTKEGGAWAGEAFTDACAAIEHSFQGDGNAANFFMDTGDALADTWGDFKSSIMPIYDTADISVCCSEKCAHTATETGTTSRTCAVFVRAYTQKAIQRSARERVRARQAGRQAGRQAEDATQLRARTLTHVLDGSGCRSRSSFRRSWAST